MMMMMTLMVMIRALLSHPDSAQQRFRKLIEFMEKLLLACIDASQRLSFGVMRNHKAYDKMSNTNYQMIVEGKMEIMEKELSEAKKQREGSILVLSLVALADAVLSQRKTIFKVGNYVIPFSSKSSLLVPWDVPAGCFWRDKYEAKPLCRATTAKPPRSHIPLLLAN